MKSKRPRRAGIYVRVSKDRTGEEATTARQEDDCRSLCDRKGWDVVDVYRDTDLSAYDPKAKRVEFDRLKADVAAGRVDAIVFWKLDRLARRVRDVIDVLDLVEETGLELVSDQESLDTSTPLGRAMVQMMGVMAQIASAETSARVKRAKLAEAQSGKDSGGGQLAFGWQVDEVERMVGARSVTVRVRSSKADPEQAEAIREVARRFLEDGESLNALAKELNERGVRMHSGKQLRIQTLRAVLANPRIAGYRVHRPEKDGHADLYEGNWDTIIDQATFRRLQSRFGNEIVDGPDGLQLARVGTSRKKVSNKRHLLTGLMWCGSCRAERMRLMTSKSKNQQRYTCAACAAVTIDAGIAEEHLTREALTILMGRRMVGRDQPAVDVATIAAEVEDLEEKLRRLTVDYYADGKITADQYSAAREPLDDRLRTAEGRLAQAERMVAAPVPDNAAKLGFEAWWAEASYDERRRVLDGAIERVLVAPLSHELADRFRKSGVVADPERSPMLGVPKRSWPAVARARMQIIWRPEVVPSPATDDMLGPVDQVPPVPLPAASGSTASPRRSKRS